MEKIIKDVKVTKKNTKGKDTKSSPLPSFQHRQRIFNNDSATNYALLANADTPKSAVEALGYTDIDPQTGEILTEKPNAFFPVERIGTAFYEAPVGEPLLVRPVCATDLKQRLIQLFGGDKAKMEQALYVEFEDDLSEEALLAQLEDEDDVEAQLLNAMSDGSPYAVGKDGLTHFERQVKAQGGDVDEFRKWQSMKDVIPEEWKKMSAEDLKSMISSLTSKQGSDPANLPSDGEE